METTFTIPKTITGKKIQLKARTIDQAQDLYNLIDKNRDHLKLWMPWVEGTKSVEDSKKFLQLMTDEWNEARVFDYSIYDIKTNKLIGSFGLHSINWSTKSCALGYWIDKDYEGKGCILEAVQLGEKLAYNLGFHRLIITCDRKNERSQKIPRILNYKLESLQIDHSIFKNKYGDNLNFVKLMNPIIPGQITENLPAGFSIKESVREEFWKLVESEQEKVFMNNELIFRANEIISKEEMDKVKSLNSHLPRSFEYYLLLLHEGKLAGWSWGRQDSIDSFYMVNSAVLPEYRGRGLYSRLMEAILEKTTSLGFQRIWSRHNMTNNAIIIPKLKRGFFVTGTELSDLFGVLIHLSYFTSQTRQKVLDFRTGHLRPDEEIKKIFKI